MVIVAAINDSDQSFDVAVQGNRLAQAFDDELHLVHVITETEYTRIVEKKSNTRETETGSIKDDEAARATSGFEEVISVNHDIVGRVGNPGKKVVEYADEVDARYLVIGGQARSPVGKAIFGSVTQSILLNTDCPVVTITAQEE